MHLSLGLYGIPLVLIVFGLQIYTAILLGRSWIIATALDPQISRKNRYSPSSNWNQNILKLCIISYTVQISLKHFSTFSLSLTFSNKNV